MNRVIFTIFDDIDNKSKSSGFARSEVEYTKTSDNAKLLLVDEYFDRLVQNKKDYAEKIGAEFIFYHNTMDNFLLTDDLEFTKINLYKHHLMAELAEEYDEVMYVDMDVLFNTDLNVFDENDLTKGFHIKDQDSDIQYRDVTQVSTLSEIGLRSPDLKYHITKRLLNGKNNHVINTGIMLANAEHIKQIKFIDRMKIAIEKINEFKKEPWHLMTDLYYPNNESIFSWILEEYKVPYVILSDYWHKIFTHKGSDSSIDYGCMHFINKQFNKFYKDKTCAIYSLYIHIPDKNLDHPKSYHDNDLNKSKIAQLAFKEYENNIIENHKNYAKAVNAEYFLYGEDEQYEEFKKRFPLLSEYNVVNLYKIWILDQLTQKYDFVLYVDFDCVFIDNINIFDTVPCNYAFVCKYDRPEWIGISNTLKYFDAYAKDFRNPQAKYWNAHALLTDEEYDGSNLVFNTGVMVASRYSMEKLDYFSDIDEVLEKMTELKEESMYPAQIRSSFGYDNETIMSYKIEKNNVLTYRLEDAWHHRNYYENALSMQKDTVERKQCLDKFKSHLKTKQPHIIHFISKNFGLVFDEQYN